MKKIILLFAVAAISFSSMAQSCEERETNLLNTLGGLSAGFMYNTYLSIGSVSDAYVKEVYTKENTLALLEEQVNLIENIRKMLNELLEKKSLTAADDQRFVKETMEVMKGLQQQARFFKEYVNTKDNTKATSYENQRQSNWKNISKLMGLDE
ncbi:MAG TPA: hypothetical protein VFS36_11405 [Chitinophagaceae bacterium]|jgi:hypothetical protein|nr:hypothetical protein [Chitinophagaceae bacterium]